MRRQHNTIIIRLFSSLLLASQLQAFDINATQKKLTALYGANSDFFGTSVSISGNYAIVGSNYDDDGGSDSGSVYLFDLNASDINSSQIKLTASDGNSSDYFGNSVAISGNYAIVGSVNDDDGGNNSGSAYLFNLNAPDINASQIKLTAFDGASNDYFGKSVSISDNYVIVGSIYDDDNLRTDSGAAYLFDLSAGDINASQIKLTTFDTTSGDSFGNSVSISDNYAIVGSVNDDDGGSDSGSAYLFDLSAGDINASQMKLTAFDGAISDYFGSSVSISSNYIIVGSQLDDDGGSDSGSAYLFNLSAGDINASQIKLTAFDGTGGDYFGTSVSISDNYTIVGSYGDDDRGSGSGSAYLFDLSAGDINVSQIKLIASDSASEDYFGRTTSISGDYIIVGSNQDDDGATNSGSAYLFTLPKLIKYNLTNITSFIPSSVSLSESNGSIYNLNGSVSASEGNYSLGLGNLDNNFSLSLSNGSNSLYYNFTNSYLYPEELNTSDFLVELNSTYQNLTIDMSKTRFYELNGSILTNDLNITQLKLVDTNSNNNYFFSPITIGGSYTFDVNRSSLYNLELIDLNSTIYYYNFSTNIVETNSSNSTTLLNSTNFLINLDLNLSLPTAIPTPTPTPTPTPPPSSGGDYVEYPTYQEPVITNDNFITVGNSEVGEVTINEDGTQVIKTDTTDNESTAFINKDGSGTAYLNKDSGDDKFTLVSFGAGTKTTLNEDGSLKFDSVVGGSNKVVVLTGGEKKDIETTIHIGVGKSVDLTSPIGSKININSDSITQEFDSIDGSIVAFSFGKDGKMVISVKSSDGNIITSQSDLNTKIAINNDGSFSQKLNLSDFAADILTSKRAEVKGSIETKSGSFDINTPKNTNVNLTSNGVNFEYKNESYSSNLNIAKDGKLNIEITPKTRARDKITYSSRAGASNIKAQIIAQSDSNLRAINNRDRAEISYSYRNSISTSLNRASNNSLTITPKGSITVKESLYFDGESILESNGTSNLNGKIANDRDFNLVGVDRITFDSTNGVESRKHYSNRIFDLRNRKTYSSRIFDFKSDYYGNINLRLTLSNDSRSLNSRESFNYSPRREFANLKLEFLESSSRALTREGIALSYSSPRRFIFESIQRDESNIEIIPKDENATFQESIYIDMNRTIQLTSGSSQIVINGITQNMQLNQEYELPMNIETDSTYIPSETITSLQIKKGWNMLGSPINEDINDIFIFKNFETIWVYQNNNWSKNPDSINYQNGFWIKSNIEQNLTFNGLTHIADIENINGWSFKSNGDSIDLSDLNLTNRKVWTYKNNSWLSNTKNNLKTIKAGDGFWVK